MKVMHLSTEQKEALAWQIYADGATIDEGDLRQVWKEFFQERYPISDRTRDIILEKVKLISWEIKDKARRKMIRAFRSKNETGL